MIECKKVSFSYPPNETDIGDREGHGTLRNIDLSINIITMESWKALSCLMEKI